jgi:hypothetical protein
MASDPIWDEIQAAAAILHKGERALARERFGAIWARIRTSPEPLHECFLSHFMADAQDDLADELSWDLRALAAAERCTEGDEGRYRKTVPDVDRGGLTVAGFFPSLHSNLADVYLRMGERAAALEHLAHARAAALGMPDNPYSAMVRRGLDRLEQRLTAGEPADPPTPAHS